MECKAVSICSLIFYAYIRIEPDWNVKTLRTILVPAHLIIRIEPDWNVKEYVGEVGTDTRGIRIEPDWNVKELQTNMISMLTALE